MKNKLFFILFFLLNISFLYLSPKILWVNYLLFFLVIILFRNKFVFKTDLTLIILSLPLLWSAIISYDVSFYSITQALFYLSLPLFLVIIGLQYSKLFSFKEILISLIYIGTFISLIYIVIIFYVSGLKSIFSPYLYARSIVGSGSPASILSLFICLYAKKYGIQLFKHSFIRKIFIIVNILAIYLFASRTYLVILLIFFIVFQIHLIIKYKYYLIISSCIIILFFFYNFTIKLDKKLNNNNSFMFKIVNSFSEIIPKKYKTFVEINEHYRSYESYRAVQTYINGSPLNLVFGHGYGTLVDLKLKILLAETFRQKIPWIHNGYYYVLIREGALGVLFILIFIVHTLVIGFKNLYSVYIENKFKSLLLIASVSSLAFANYVVCAFHTFEMSVLMITIGILIYSLTNKNELS